MILFRCHIQGFGKIAGLSLTFKDGLNLVFAPNEGGKSTLQHFLIGALYGQLRPDLRMQRRLDPWAEQYKPWRGSDYGGILWCRLASGRELEIHRTFGKEDTRIEIRTVGGEDISSQYEQQKNGDLLFARQHLGMPKDLFESIAVIRENKVAELNGCETIRDRIANLAQSGDEELSVRQSLNRLQQALDSIGSDRAPTKPYRQTVESLRALQSEQNALAVRRAQFHGWIEERGRLAELVSSLEQELKAAQQTATASRYREMAHRVETMESLELEIRALRADIESLSVDPMFPAHLLDELNQLSGAQDSIENRLAQARIEKEALQVRLDQVGKERATLGPYADFIATTEAEKVTDWFVSYLSQTLLKDNLQKTRAALFNERNSLEQALGGLSPVLTDSEVDWERKAREAADEEGAIAQEKRELSDRIARQKETLARINKGNVKKGIWAGLCLLLALMPAAAQFALPQFSLSFGVGAGMAAVLGILAVVLGFRIAKSRKNGEVLEGDILGFENMRAQLDSQGGKSQRELRQAMQDSKLVALEEFLAVAKQSELSRRRMADLGSRIEDLEHQHSKMQADCAELFNNLKQSLVKVGLVCSPGNLKFQIDAMRSNMRRFREIDARFNACERETETLKVGESRLAGEYEHNALRMQDILNEGKIQSVEAFREECSKLRRLVELREKESSRTREFQRLCGDLTLEKWRESLQELEGLQKRQASEPADESGGLVKPDAAGTAEPCLPYFPSVAEAEQEERRVITLLASAREEHARVMERARQAFQNCRGASEIEEDIAMAERSLQVLESDRQALQTAIQMIEMLSRQQQEVLAPQLNSTVEQRFLRLCAHRYEEVRIDPDFQVWVREIDTGELRLAEQLSRGTQDQLYFALRFGILDLVANEAEPSPCLLDEPFAAYDQIRVSEALQVLRDEAERRQLFLFTCREDLAELAEKAGAHIISLQ